LPDTPMAPVVGLAARLRQAGITVELYPEQARVGRQLSLPMRCTFLRPDYWRAGNHPADIHAEASSHW
jgi:hypothetical protein